MITAANTPSIPGRPKLRVQADSPMSLHTTWRIGGPADYLVRATSADDLIGACAWAADEGVPVTVIGGGSNLLVDDAGIRGLVVLVRTPGERAGDLLQIVDHGESARVRVGGQAPISWVGRIACEGGWAGLDWAVGLPGAVGGACVNNAGAHGVEFIDHLESVTVLTVSGHIESHPAAWLEAAYRHTTIKASPRPRSHHVISVELRLPRGNREHLIALADEHAEYRKRTQPTGACAGSTFTNPPGDFAGRLIEAAGLKGFQIGPVSISTKHANFIVNAGGGSAENVRELIAHTQCVVQEQFGVSLQAEIETLGGERGRK
jgi:UDP-N-acetylmuramate dehydrogenase